jgi:hypothetical protein
MSKGASETQTLGHFRAINYSGLLAGWLVTSLSRFEPKKVLQKPEHLDTFAP